MLDPFPIPAPLWAQQLVGPFADYLALPTFHLHFHEVVLASAFYTFIYSYVAPRVSTWAAPGIYPQLNKRTRINWDVHVVSFVQSIIICVLALYVMQYDLDRKNMDWAGKIWGYTGACGLVQAIAGGYFIWDLVMSLRYPSIFGPGMLAHAIAATVVFFFGFVSTTL